MVEVGGTSDNLQFTNISDLRMQRRSYNDFVKLCPFEDVVKDLILDYVRGSLDNQSKANVDKYHMALGFLDTAKIGPKKCTIQIAEKYPNDAHTILSKEMREAIIDEFKSENVSEHIELYALWCKIRYIGSVNWRTKKYLFVGQVKLKKLAYPKYLYFSLETEQPKRGTNAALKYVDLRLSPSIETITLIVQGKVLKKFYPRSYTSAKEGMDDENYSDF